MSAALAILFLTYLTAVHLAALLVFCALRAAGKHTTKG